MGYTTPEQTAAEKLTSLASQSRTDQLHFTIAILLEKSGRFAEAMLKLEELYQHNLHYQHAKGDSYHAAYSKAFIQTNIAQGMTDNLGHNLRFFLELLFSEKLDKTTVMPFIQKAYANLLTSIQYKQQKQEVTEAGLLRPIPIRPALTPSPATTHDRTSESEAHETETSKQKQAICQRSPSPTYSEISDLTVDTDYDASSSSSKPKTTSTERRSHTSAARQKKISNRLSAQPEKPWGKSPEGYRSVDHPGERCRGNRQKNTSLGNSKSAFLNQAPHYSRTTRQQRRQANQKAVKQQQEKCNQLSQPKHRFGY